MAALLLLLIAARLSSLRTMMLRVDSVTNELYLVEFFMIGMFKWLRWMFLPMINDALSIQRRRWRYCFEIMNTRNTEEEKLDSCGCLWPWYSAMWFQYHMSKMSFFPFSQTSFSQMQFGLMCHYNSQKIDKKVYISRRSASRWVKKLWHGMQMNPLENFWTSVEMDFIYTYSSLWEINQWAHNLPAPPCSITILLVLVGVNWSKWWHVWCSWRWNFGSERNGVLSHI